MAVAFPAAAGSSGYQEFDPESIEREQTPRLDLMIPLSEGQRERLALHLRYEIDRYLQATQTRRGNCQQWRRDYELYPPGRGTRWPGSSDVPAPLTHIYCQSHHTRLNQQITGGDPPFAIVARRQSAQDVAAWIEEALAAALEESEWIRFADEIHCELPVVGNVFARVTYEEEFIHAPQFQFDFDDEAFLAMTEAGVDPQEALGESFAMDENGELEVFLGFVDIQKFAGVRFKTIPFEDGIITPVTIRDPKEARGIGERMLVKGVELVTGAREGKYWPEAVRAVLGRQSTGDSVVAGDDSRTERLEVQGIGDATGWMGQEDPRYREYLIYEFNWRDDWNGDGKEEWAILTYDYQSNTLLRAQYLPYEHGQPYYHLIRYYTRPQELFGMSVAEKLACLQDAATAIINQIIDHADLVLNLHGNFFFDASADFNPDRYQAQLGKPIQVGNVDGIKMIELNPIPAQHYQAYQLIKDMCDLVTATSNPSLGRATDTDKTLGEVQIVASASSMIFEEVARRVAYDHARLWDQFRWLLGQFGQDGQLTYRVAAAPGHNLDVGGGSQPGAYVNGELTPAPGGVAFGTIPAELLLSEVDIVPTGLAELSEYNARLQQATIVQNTLLVHPLTQMNNEALKVALDVFLQAVGYRQREKIMAAVEQALMAQQLVAEMQQQLGMAQGAMDEAGRQEKEAGKNTRPGDQPQMQGPQGQQGALPQATPTLTGNATAQGNLQPPAPIAPGMP